MDWALQKAIRERDRLRDDYYGAAATIADVARALAMGPGFTSGELVAQVVALRAERDRLARVLAVERGDESQAPDGWRRWGGGWERRPDPAGPAEHFIQHFHSQWPTPHRWERRGIRIDDPRHREWPTALEAMEALDAEVSDAQA